jgi:phage shock protein C
MTDSTTIKRLYKSRTDRMIDGVCGGIAKYFNVDPTLVRIAWVLLALLGGSGILLYIIAMMVMPKEPYIIPNVGTADPMTTAGSSEASPSSKKNSLFWGILLMGVGIALFLNNMGVSWWHPWWWFDKDMFLSVLLILVGVAFLWGGRNSLSNSAGAAPRSESPAGNVPHGQTPRRLYRSFQDSKLFGVCGGLGEYFGIDSTIVRILVLVGAFASGGAIVLGYLIMAIVVPKQIPSFKPM